MSAQAGLRIRSGAGTVQPADLTYDARGLLPVVVQDVGSGAVLMLAWANAEAVRLCLETGLAHFWSRSRQSLWRKGETSGNELQVVEVLTDCDRDTLLLRVEPSGPACHLGTRSCFEPNPARLELGWLAEIVHERAARAATDTSYTARLLAAGRARIAQKVGEEGLETALAAVTGEPAGERVGPEAADLLYHLLVLLEEVGIDSQRIAQELRQRHRSSGRAPEGAGESAQEGVRP